jgi:hypothetical protein
LFFIKCYKFLSFIDTNARKGDGLVMNHNISSTIGDILEEQGTSLSISEVVSKLKEMFPEAELEEFYKELKFNDLEQAVKAIIDDIKG